MGAIVSNEHASNQALKPFASLTASAASGAALAQR